MRSATAPAKHRPLSGRVILVSRARKQASALSAGLRKLGARVLEIPFIEIRPPASFKPLNDALDNVAAYDWLILTSVNGVEAMFARMKKLRMEASCLRHLKIAAIGPATRRAIEQQGLKVDVVPEKYIAESVVESLAERTRRRRVLLVRAKVARDVIPRELRNAGARVDVVEAYETVAPRESKRKLVAALKGRARPHVITFTSSSTARNFVDLLGPRDAYSGLLDGVKLASIGPVTSATLRELSLPVDVEAREFTIPGLIQAIVAAE